MAWRITGVALVLFVATPIRAGELDNEFAGAALQKPALVGKRADNLSKTSAVISQANTGSLANSTVAKGSELDAESPTQAGRGGGGRGFAGGGARGFSGGGRGFGGAGVSGFRATASL